MAGGELRFGTTATYMRLIYYRLAYLSSRVRTITCLHSCPKLKLFPKSHKLLRLLGRRNFGLGPRKTHGPLSDRMARNRPASRLQLPPPAFGWVLGTKTRGGGTAGGAASLGKGFAVDLAEVHRHVNGTRGAHVAAHAKRVCARLHERPNSLGRESAGDEDLNLGMARKIEAGSHF